MKNKAVILITILFSLMLVGIVLIQAWWVKRAEKLNSEAFDAAVYRSLQGVVKQTAEKENFSFIKSEYMNDTLIKTTKKTKLFKNRSKRAIRYSTSNSIKISITGDSSKHTQTIVRIEKDDNGKQTIQNSVVVGAGEQIESPMPPEFPKAPLAIPEDKIEDIEVLVQKMSSTKNPDSISLKPKEIEKLIKEQLKQNDLPADFSFCLLSKDPKKSFVQTGKEFGIPYRINLYPYDIFGREVTLVLFFSPDNYKTGNKDWYLPQLLSLFFTLSLLLLFAYSMRMLVRHKKMLEAKNDFINHMSHEFKTPLAGISLGADILMEKTGQMNSEQIHKVAGTIKKQSLRLSKEVNDVLQNALLEENINRPHALFNIVEIVKTQIELFQPQIDILNANIISNFSSDKIIINGDEIQWQKIFSNLIDNALKFSRENPEVIISVSSVGNKVKIEFADNGIGIAAKDLPHIFEKFFRSDYYRQSNIQGFGLGLSFVKNIVDAHKGIIKAESELNKGTKITIEINAEA